MSDQQSIDVRAYQKEQLSKLAPLVLSEAIKVLRTYMPLPALNNVREVIEAGGADWWMPHQNTFGADVRDLLRSCGIHDHLTPNGTLDDLWVPLIEIAVGGLFLHRGAKAPRPQ